MGECREKGIDDEAAYAETVRVVECAIEKIGGIEGNLTGPS
jgi:hypothetical protein